MHPQRRTSADARLIACRVRKARWAFMAQLEAHGTVWFCAWNKRRLPEGEDELRCGLLSGIKYVDWIEAHPDWFHVGAWDTIRYAQPVQLTEAGQQALYDRERYDVEDVAGESSHSCGRPWPATQEISLCHQRPLPCR
jgi:hypothetical protein